MIQGSPFTHQEYSSYNAIFSQREYYAYHCRKLKEEQGCSYAYHYVMAKLNYFPLLGHITAIFETAIKAIVDLFKQSKKPLENRDVAPINKSEGQSGKAEGQSKLEPQSSSGPSLLGAASSTVKENSVIDRDELSPKPEESHVSSAVKDVGNVAQGSLQVLESEAKHLSAQAEKDPQPTDEEPEQKEFQSFSGSPLLRAASPIVPADEEDHFDDGLEVFDSLSVESGSAELELPKATLKKASTIAQRSLANFSLEQPQVCEVIEALVQELPALELLSSAIPEGLEQAAVEEDRKVEDASGAASSPLSDMEKKLHACFAGIHSDKIVPLPKHIKINGQTKRWQGKELEEFLKKEGESWQANPVIVATASFIPASLARHLMQNKAKHAIGQKYISNAKKQTCITPLEAALHSFVTALVPITMRGDYVYESSNQVDNPRAGQKTKDGKKEPDTFSAPHTVIPLTNEQGEDCGRQVLLSTCIQPDCEKPDDKVIMHLIGVQEQATKGKELPDSYQPLFAKGFAMSFEERAKLKDGVKEYDQSLLKHGVYHLTKDHYMPSRQELVDNPGKYKIYEMREGREYLEKLIEGESFSSDSLATSFVKVKTQFKIKENGKEKTVKKTEYISLEALVNVYKIKLQLEFSQFKKFMPQGVDYTIDPASIFVQGLGKGGAELLNRAQALAFKQLDQHFDFQPLIRIGFNDYADKKMIQLLKRVFKRNSHVQIMQKSAFFQNGGRYSLEGARALLLHNNSDAFGQNIQYEKSAIQGKRAAGGSMDAAIGSNSDAARHLLRSRSDFYFVSVPAIPAT